MGSASPVVQTRYWVEPGASPHTFDSSSERIDPYAWSVGKKGTILFADTIRGTRDQPSERTRSGPYMIRGRITLPVDVALMDLWLPRILGGNESADVFPVAETLPAFGLLADLGGNTHEFKDCYVNAAVISGRQYNGQGAPEPLTLMLDIIGTDEAVGTSAPSVSLSTAANTAPLMFEDGVFTMQSGARDIQAFNIGIYNMLRPRWANSLKPTVIYPSGRLIQVNTICAYTSSEASALYGQGYAGASATFTFTNGNTSFGFTFGRLQVPPETPEVQGRGEVLLKLNGVGRAVTTTKSIVGANDSTV